MLRSRLARRVAGALAALAPVLALPALAAPAEAARPVTAPPAVTTWEYLPGVEADLHLPATRGRRPVPVVVLVPGGGWQSADRTGLGQLAEALAAGGVAVSNATYRIGDDASRFPVPAEDISCAVDAAVASVREAGLRPGKVVLAGHSAGAHLSSLVAFGGETFRSGECPYPQAEIDGWVGLSGFYDLALVGPMAAPMMGASPEEDPEAYARATTSTYLPESRRRQHLDALVVHGDADELGITAEYATGVADQVRAAGYRTRLHVVEGGDHAATYQAPVVARTILRWLCQVQP